MSPLISESKENFPILIVDKTAVLGNRLSEKLSEEATIVLVTQSQPPPFQNIIHIPFEKKIPKVPDNIYSHIFVIDDREDSTIEFLPSFLKKAQNDKAVFCFCTVLDRQEKIPPEVFEYKKGKVLFIGDIFPAGGLFSKSYINRFLTMSKNRGRIEVPQDGMSISYPIFLEDTIPAILEASFGTDLEKTYYLFGKHGITLLSLAHIIQKTDPNIKIDFVEEPTQNVQVIREGKYLVSDKYPLEDRIKSLKIQAGHFERKNIEKETDEIYKKNDYSFKNLRIIVFGILFFLFLPLITTLVFSYLGFLFLDKSRVALDSSRAFINISKSSFDLATVFSKPLIYETEFFKNDLLTKLIESVEKGKIQSENISEYHIAMDLFSEGKTNEAIFHIKNFLVFAQSEKFKIFDNNTFNFISQTINVWPQILGVDSKKTYLVIFQNNLISRPTGGLIQAYGLLTFDNGKISDFTTYNTYNTDKNLKGHVEPPFAIRRYLPSAHWFLKDSNFNPDFKESAQSASFFVDLETGEKVDGLIALNLNSLQKIMELVNDKNSNNFLEIAKTKINDHNYLTEVASSFKKSFEKKNIARIFLSKDISDLILKKDIIFAFNDQSIENIFSTNNFSSSFSDYKVDSPRQINDFFAVSEVNLDKFSQIKRKINHKVELKENGGILSTVSLEFKNLGNEDYKNYLRFVIPQGSTLKEIKIDGSQKDFTDAITDPTIYEAKDFIPSQKIEVEKYNQGDKGVFGFLVIIPRGKTQTIEATFNLPEKPPLTALSNFSLDPQIASFAYNLHFFKQPGVENFPYKFSIVFPVSFKIYSNPSFSKTVDKDFDLNFKFSK